MKNFVHILIFLFLCFSVKSQTKHVLFIGNSFTMNHEMPGKLATIAKNEGKSLYVDQVTRGGMDWQYHANNPVTYQKIKSEPWDYVVLQAKSFEPILDSMTVEKTTKKYGKKIIDSIKFHHPEAKIMLFMTWGYKEGMLLEHNQRSINYNEMQNLLKKKYLLFADEFKVAVAPVGEVWQQFMHENPDFNLYEKDNYHQNLTGSFLIASSFYTMIFQQAITNFKKLPYTIPEMEARKIADKAREVVLNPNYDWREQNWSPNTYTDFVLFDYRIKSNVLFLNSSVPKEYDVKWKIDGKTVSRDQSVVVPLKTNQEFEIELISSEGILRNREKENAIYKSEKRLVPIE